MVLRRWQGVLFAGWFRSCVRGPAVLAVVLVLSWCPLVAAEPNKRVVVIYPDEGDGAPGIILVNRAIHSTFENYSPGQIEIRNEYVDTARLRDTEFMRTQVALLQRKYAGRKVDLVIAGLSSGLDFALAHRAELFPGVPIVYVAVDQREVKTRQLPADVIGVPIRMDLKGTLDVALRFHPDTRRVYVVAGSAPFDLEWTAEARRTFHPYEDRVEFIYLTGLPMAELLARVGGLPERSILYYLHINRDGAGRSFFPAQALELLAPRTNVPIYGHVDTFVGRGIVGGHVFDFETEGRSAAQLGLRVLVGEKPETIPLPESNENIHLFDARQLRRWGIGEENLPPGSTVRFREPSIWTLYRWRIVAGITLCVVEAVLCAVLLIQLVKRRRAEARFRQVVETAPTAMLMIGQDGAIVLVNAHIERLFGYSRQELLGQPVELLVPESARGRHPTNRERFFAKPDARPMGAGRDLFGLRKDGSEFPVAIDLSPLRTGQGLFVLASVTDLTERRMVEDRLRANQRELQLLARRLLEAQETERSRIARELHDDLNQSLALVSMEMDLLAGSLPGSPTAAAERVRELSGRIKELSSAVHDLSHQLHPSKLEHMGLVAAVRGLCQELRHSHALDVTFTHDPDPGTVPPAAALCLYRIAQEALRNVIKHSGSQRATVSLTGTEDTLQLRITDDGIGFDPAAVTEGLGLVSMRERLSLIGGTIAIDSRPSGGTRIDVRIPVPSSPDSRTNGEQLATVAATEETV
jgi:PAS domain S-box-containing protein